MQSEDADKKCTRVQRQPAYIEALKAYKKLSMNIDNHRALIKDQTVLMYVGVLLVSTREDVLRLCLDILTNLTRNPVNRRHIQDVCGVFESVNALLARKNLSYELSIQAKTILGQVHAVKQRKTQGMQEIEENLKKAYFSKIVHRTMDTIKNTIKDIFNLWNRHFYW